jgi:galactokinase
MSSRRNMAHADHVQTVVDAFEHRYGRAPEKLARVPGRVNIIGEHTDYSLLPVLPMAIDREVVIALAATDEPVIDAYSLTLDSPTCADRRSLSEAPEGSWGAYMVGAARHLTDIEPGLGAQMVIGGNLPTTGGLSSSTALTMGSIAALNAAWNGTLSREEIVARDVLVEREVGVESGAMDQIAIAFARRDSALRIDFAPTMRHNVALKSDLRWIIASSGTAAPKGSKMRDGYNERVVGCRMAAALIAHEAGILASEPPALADVFGLKDIDARVEALSETLTPGDVAFQTDREASALVLLAAGAFDQQRRVPLRRYARHVIGEARRVDAVERYLEKGSGQRVGSSLDESQDSLREDFDCSTDALDRLCTAMRDAGAYGARLTGAGFGGYALAASPPDRVDAVIEAARVEIGGPAFEVQPSDGFTIM